MKHIFLLSCLLLALASQSLGQSSFAYSLELIPVEIPGLPGLHSYAFGQHQGKWLVIGGRKDGLHARQPFNAFPAPQNNTNLYVVDVQTRKFWSASLNTLPTGIREQLQSTNMNFYQDADTLYIAGGYAYSTSAGDHITFPNLTAIQVSSTIEGIMQAQPIAPYFKQITDDVFAITGGQLGKLADTFYLVGGQRFDGRYNPMGHSTFTQAYSNQIRKFTIDNQSESLRFGRYSAITDPIHLRRRDYNLLPQIFPDGAEGYTISSGVFQMNADLPFLYPVDITPSGYTPITTFNQYLSNYHSAKACLYDRAHNEMHTLFFGGMSQHYYQNGQLIQDPNVPFVKTISRLTRFADGTLSEFQLPLEMPALEGASAEFIPNHQMPHSASEIIQLSEILENEFIIGHIYGGILSPTRNPFFTNQTSTTSATPAIYAVKLIKGIPSGVQEINGKNPYSVKVYPNPAPHAFTFEIRLEKISPVNYFISNSAGQILEKGQFVSPQVGINKARIQLDKALPRQPLFLTLVVDHRFYITQKILRE